MYKYTGFIIAAVLLLSILIGVFWNEIIQMDAIAIGAFIIFGLLFFYVIGRGLLYRHIDWSKPNVFIRPFLPPLGGEKPHRFTDQNESLPQERQEDEE